MTQIVQKGDLFLGQNGRVEGEEVRACQKELTMYLGVYHSKDLFVIRELDLFDYIVAQHEPESDSYFGANTQLSQNYDRKAANGRLSSDWMAGDHNGD